MDVRAFTTQTPSGLEVLAGDPDNQLHRGFPLTVNALGHDSSLQATPGFDDATGVGTPSPGYLDSYR